MLNKNKAFYFDDTPTMPGKFILRVNPEYAFCSGTEGSYGVLPARLLHISYPDFLRLCRDVCGAELYGKNCKYIVPYFTLNEESKTLVDLLNNMIDTLNSLKQSPDWELKKKFVDQYYNKMGQVAHPLSIDDINSIKESV